MSDEQPFLNTSFDAASRNSAKSTNQKSGPNRIPDQRQNRRQTRGRILGKLGRLFVFFLVLGSLWLFFRLPEYFEKAGFNLVPVAGKVIIDGAPADAARLVFVPLERNYERNLHPISVATTGKDGAFQLQTVAGKQGAVRGRHLVYVLPTPNLFPVVEGNPELPPDLPTGAPNNAEDAWREAADLLGFWISAAPVRDETTVPFFGTHTLEINLKRQE